MEHVISELCCKGTILQSNYRKMHGHFLITPLQNFMVKILKPQNDHVISNFQIIVIRSYVILKVLYVVCELCY